MRPDNSGALGACRRAGPLDDLRQVEDQLREVRGHRGRLPPGRAAEVGEDQPQVRPLAEHGREVAGPRRAPPPVRARNATARPAPRRRRARTWGGDGDRSARRNGTRCSFTPSTPAAASSARCAVTACGGSAVGSMLTSTSAIGLSSTVRAIHRLEARIASAATAAASAAPSPATVAACSRARAVSNRCTTMARSKPAFS